ncbi:MAG: hypothetical protein B7Z08_01555 [Sphingomonadales bacterium 32-68-7]|nr:MAG: hypothetical protein B7Z33_00395 [Sphingomonadales bacterium 12-68-11]OYX10265.1 MAG: hypothetical protein B7Z08_01555 [Sphingomonadales bacterium 32-68-7]
MFAASAASAQEARTATPAEEDKIVVTGQSEQPSSSEVSRQARSITQGGNFRRSALARFERRLCPGVIGLTPDMAALVIDRIRFNAAELGLGLTEDDGSCTPNLVVAFVKDGQAELNALAKDHGYMFNSLELHEKRALLAETGPVRVFTSTLERTRDGMPIARNEGGDPPVAQMWMAHSKIYLATREDIEFVMVMFDLEKLKGKTLVQLADYATMRGLARTKPVDEDGQPLDTILALFDQDGAPTDELTSFDRAYLASVYDSIPNLPGSVRLMGVNRQLELQAAAEERAARNQR